MKMVIKVKNGPFGKWKTKSEVVIQTSYKGQPIKETLAGRALETEMKLNGGVSVYTAESIAAKTGNHTAPIYRVDIFNTSGKRVS